MQAELLNDELCSTLKEAKVLLEMWRKEYNTIRPHSALGYQPTVPEAILNPILSTCTNIKSGTNNGGTSLRTRLWEAVWIADRIAFNRRIRCYRIALWINIQPFQIPEFNVIKQSICCIRTGSKEKVCISA